MSDTFTHPVPSNIVSTVVGRINAWFHKYIFVEQHLEKSATQVDVNAPFYVRYRRLLSLVIPAIVVEAIWLAWAVDTNMFHLFTGDITAEHSPRWYATLTMVFGSMVAGATSEGGASVAFPVLTLAMEVAPSVARDFSFMIQSVGMTAAAFSIFFMRVKLEWRAIIYCSIGGVGGLIYGLEKIAPLLEPAYNKMYFVCIWFAFAFALFWINRYRDRKVYPAIPFWQESELIRYDVGIKVLSSDIAFVLNWRALVLVCTGFLGGIFTSMSGSGIDICCFAVLALLFRVSERIATPTSVVLMAINTVVAFMYRRYSMVGEISQESYNLWYVCIPVVVIGAPLGAVVSSHLNRIVLAFMIYLTDVAQLAGALYVVRPWTTEKTDTPVDLCIKSAVILVSGGVFFSLLALAGQRIMAANGENPTDEPVAPTNVRTGGCSTPDDLESAVAQNGSGNYLAVKLDDKTYSTGNTEGKGNAVVEEATLVLVGAKEGSPMDENGMEVVVS